MNETIDIAPSWQEERLFVVSCLKKKLEPFFDAMPFSGNRRPVFNAMLLAQASFFYYFKRKTTAAERGRSEARISVLESVVEQLQSNRPLSDSELARLRRLAAPRPPVTEPERHYEPVPWKEIVWGRGKQKSQMDLTDAYLDKIAEELEKTRQES